MPDDTSFGLQDFGGLLRQDVARTSFQTEGADQEVLPEGLPTTELATDATGIFRQGSRSILKGG